MMICCYYCDPIQEFACFEDWGRHQMDVHNISCEFYHPSAARLAHVSRYVTYQSVPQPANLPPRGYRFESRPGELYSSSSFRPRPAVLPPEMRGSSSMARMQYPEIVAPGTVASVAMDMSGAGPMPPYGPSMAMGQAITKTSPHFSPPRNWQQGQQGAASVSMPNYEGLPVMLPMKSSTPETTANPPFWPIDLGPGIQTQGSGQAMTGEVGNVQPYGGMEFPTQPRSMQDDNIQSAREMEHPAPIVSVPGVQPGSLPVSVGVGPSPPFLPARDCRQGPPGLMSNAPDQASNMGPSESMDQTGPQGEPGDAQGGATASNRGRRLEDTKRKAKGVYYQRKTLTIRMEAVEDKLIELEQRLDGCEELADQLRGMLGLSLP